MVADKFENVQGSKKAFETTNRHVLGAQRAGHEGPPPRALSAREGIRGMSGAPAARART